MLPLLLVGRAYPYGLDVGEVRPFDSDHNLTQVRTWEDVDTIGHPDTHATVGTRAEDLPAITDLFRRHADSVARVLRYAGVRESDLEDAVQEVFLVAHRRHGELQGGRPDRWLRTIAFFVARNARRSRRRRPERDGPPVSEPSAAPEQPEQLERARMRERLQTLLDALPDEQRALVVLYEIEQLPMREVAEELGVPLQTAYSRARAAREALRRAWEDGDR